MNRFTDQEFKNLVKSFDYLLDSLKETERTINDQDPAKDQLRSSIKIFKNLRNAVVSTYESIG